MKTLRGFLQMICLPTMAAMAIAGIWHGAGLQYLIFGLLHGIYLTVAHGWRLFRPKAQPAAATRLSRAVRHGGGVLLTYACVLLAQVFFRAPSTNDALLLLHRMFTLSMGPAVSNLSERMDIWHLAVGYIIIWTLPNTQEILIHFKPALRLASSDHEARLVPVFWKPSLAWGVTFGLLLFYVLSHLENPAAFLYFQF